MRQVFQPVLQTVEFTGGFVAKHRLALANLAQHVTQLQVCLAPVVLLQVSLSFPSVIDYSFFEGVNSSVGFTSSESLSSPPQLHCTVRSLKKPSWLSPLGMSGKYPLY